jgi:endonuclease-3
MPAKLPRQPRTDPDTMARMLAKLASGYEIDRFKRVHGNDPFRILIGCLISLRTKDEVSYAATDRLFARASTPHEMRRLREPTVAKLIYPAGFYRVKAGQIREISKLLIDRWGGVVPSTIEELVELPGVGRKTANLTVTLGFDLPGICVDIHVHRICHRFGWVRTKNPDQTETVLRRKLPPAWWIPINETLVRHGQQVCKPVSPLCSSCPVESDCPRRGVTRRR